MEREPAVLADEGNPDVYLQHAIHSRLNRPSSLPVFHTGPRPHLTTSFQASPYHYERKYQSDIFKQPNQQSEFMTGDPFIMTHPHVMHHTQHSSQKLNSPQFIGELRREAGVAFQHVPFAEQKTFVNERTITDYSPLSLKCSPLFPYDIPFPYEDRQLSPYPKESHNSHVFSPIGSFARQPYKSGTERMLHPINSSSFSFEKLQSQFRPSPLGLKMQGNVNSRSEPGEILSANKRPIDSRSGYFEEGHSFVNGQRHDRSQGDFQTLDSGHLREKCITSSQDHELQRYYQLPVDRQKGALSSHELNQTRKSVICISSKEEGTTVGKKDSQASPNQLRSYDTRISPMDFLPVNRMMGAEPSSEIPHYLVPSPSKVGHFAAPNLFESMFNIRDNGNQSLGSRSTQQSANAEYDLFQNGGYSLKTFKEKFLINDIEKEDHAEQAFKKASSEPSREMSFHKSNTCHEEVGSPVANLKSKGYVEENISQLAGNHMNGNHTECKNICSAVNDSVHELASIQEVPVNVDNAVDQHAKRFVEADKESCTVKENSIHSDLLQEESVADFSTLPDATELRNEDSTELRNEAKSIHDDHFQHTIEPAKGEKDSENYCDKGMEIDNLSEDYQDDEEGDTMRKNKGADDVEAKSMGSNEDLDREDTEEESSPEETTEDPVVKRVLSREERAIQYAVERFKEMEEKELTPRTGKRRGRGKKEGEKQLRENVKTKGDTNNEKSSYVNKQHIEMKSEGKKIVVGQKRKKAVKFEDESVFEKENCIKVKNGRIESSEGVLATSRCHKSLSKDFCVGKDARLTKDSGDKKHTKYSEKEERLNKKEQKASALQDSLDEKDMGRCKNDMQQKSYLLVPSYRGFKDFAPVVLEGRTRQRSTRSDAEKASKKKFPILVVETVGEKQNQILVKENEDLDTKIAKESLLAEKAFEHHDGIDDCKTQSALKRLSCNRMTGETVLHKAARLGYDDVVGIKIRAGADVNAKDNAGWTALHEACLRGKVDVVRVLLAYGADPNCRSESGIRPLHDAIDSNNMDIIRLLLSYGADISLETYSGIKSFQLARSTQVKEFLKGYIGDIKQPTLLENLEDYMEDRWHFRGTSSFLDGDMDDAKEIFQDVPANPDVPIEFVASNKEPLAMYNLPVFEDDVVTGFRNYYLLEDVLSYLSVSRNTFLRKHKVELRVLDLNELLSFVNQSQVTTLPNPSMSSSGESLIELVHMGHFTSRKLFDLKVYQL